MNCSLYTKCNSLTSFSLHAECWNESLGAKKPRKIASLKLTRWLHIVISTHSLTSCYWRYEAWHWNDIFVNVLPVTGCQYNKEPVHLRKAEVLTVSLGQDFWGFLSTAHLLVAVRSIKTASWPLRSILYQYRSYCEVSLKRKTNKTQTTETLPKKVLVVIFLKTKKTKKIFKFKGFYERSPLLCLFRDILRAKKPLRCALWCHGEWRRAKAIWFSVVKPVCVSRVKPQL